jgi:hypothetical protein
MMLVVARFVNLVLTALLAGNEFGIKVAIHPSLDSYTNWQRPTRAILRHAR